MQFRVLGPLEVESGDRRAGLASERRRTILGVLLAAGGEVVSVGRLTEAVWGSEPSPTALTSLRSHISRLRGELAAVDPVGADVVVTEPDGCRLAPDAGELDAARFEELVARSRAATNPVDAVAWLHEAEELWRGPAFGELADREIVRPQAVRLEELRASAATDRGVVLRPRGRRRARVRAHRRERRRRRRAVPAPRRHPFGDRARCRAPAGHGHRRPARPAFRSLGGADRRAAPRGRPPPHAAGRRGVVLRPARRARGAAVRRAVGVRRAVLAGSGRAGGRQRRSGHRRGGGVLGELVDKSMVAAERAGDAVRYRLLGTLRDYGAARLAGAGATHRARRAHVDYRLPQAADLRSSSPRTVCPRG